MSKPVFSDLFKFSGRRNRRSYFLYSLVAWLLLVGAAVVSGQLGGDHDYTEWHMIVRFACGVIVLVVGVSSYAVGSQRCHDFGWSGLSILLALIPVAGIIFLLCLYFYPALRATMSSVPILASSRAADGVFCRRHGACPVTWRRSNASEQRRLCGQAAKMEIPHNIIIPEGAFP